MKQLEVKASGNSYRLGTLIVSTTNDGVAIAFTGKALPLRDDLAEKIAALLAEELA